MFTRIWTGSCLDAGIELMWPLDVKAMLWRLCVDFHCKPGLLETCGIRRLF